MDKRGGDGGCCLAVQGVTNTTDVAYVVVTGTRELQSLEICSLNEREGSKAKLRLRAYQQGRIG